VATLGERTEAFQKSWTDYQQTNFSVALLKSPDYTSPA
jgi:hypothetical protein